MVSNTTIAPAYFFVWRVCQQQSDLCHFPNPVSYCCSTLAEAASDVFPVFHADSPNASVGGRPASLIQSGGLLRDAAVLFFLTCSLLAAIVHHSGRVFPHSTVQEPGRQKSENTGQTIRSVDIMTVFEQQTPKCPNLSGSTVEVPLSRGAK